MNFRHKNLFLLACLIFRLSIYAQNNYLFDSASIQIHAVNINTHESEFGPYKIGKVLYYSSSKERKVGLISLEESTLHQMLDLYSGVLVDSVHVRNAKALSDKINNPLNQGSCFFDKDSSRLYYSSDAYIPSKSGKKKYKLAIYSSELKGNVFGPPRAELILPDTFSASHPMIYDNKLYFAANLPEGKGKTDIYFAEKIDNEWKNIKNYFQINTEESEFFPYVINENEIYFSSNKPGGFGKLDLYKYTKIDNKSSIQNLGFPINSSADDFGIYVDSLEENGYFSTNRIDNQDDIYHFSKIWPAFKNCAEAVVEDYCYNLSEESTLNTDSLKGYYYEWLFGDGTKQKGLEVRHCFPGPGNYLISLNVIDSTTKAVFMTQASFDLNVDSIVQLKINCLDTVCVNKQFNISTVGTFLPDKKITGYYFEIDKKRIRANSIDHSFSEVGVHQVKLGITHNYKGSKKKELMCSTKNIVVVDEKTWVNVEKRKIDEEILKYSYRKMKLDSQSVKNINYDNDDISAEYKKLGLNGREVQAGIKSYMENRSRNGNRPEEISGANTTFSLKDKYKKSGIDTLFNLKEGDGVTFKVHLGKSKNLKDTTVISANGVVGIKEPIVNGEYHYTVGDEKKINDIEKYYKNAVKAGIKYPVVIAYKNDVIIEDQSKNLFQANFTEDTSLIIRKPLAKVSTTTDVALTNNGKDSSDIAKNTNNKSNLENKSNSVKSEHPDTILIPSKDEKISTITKNATSKDSSNSNNTNKSKENIANNNSAKEVSNNSEKSSNSNSNENSKENGSKNINVKDTITIVRNSKEDPNSSKNKYEESSDPSDPENEIATAASEINEAIQAGKDFVPKTKIQRKIMLYLKKFGEVSAKDLQFKVQVGVYKHRKKYPDSKLNDLGEFEYESMDDGLTRMTIGGAFKTLKEAFALNKKVVKAGQEDAFVSVYYKGKRIYIENLDKKNLFRKNKRENVIEVDEENLAEIRERKNRKVAKEKTEPKAEVIAEIPKYIEYDTKDFVPTTAIHRKTIAFIEKYGDKAIDGVEYKVQIALYRYRKFYDFPKLKQFGIIESTSIENGITQMTIGGTFKTLREAFELNKKVIMAGQTDAFICVFYNGKRIYIENLEKKGLFNEK